VPADPEFQAALEADVLERRLRSGKLASLMVAVLMPAGSLADFFVYPEQLRKFLGLRLGCSLLALGVYWLHTTGWGRRHLHWLGMPIALLPAAFLAAMIAQVEGFNSPYYAALNLVLLGVNALVQWDLRESLIATLTILLLYALAGAVSSVPLELGTTFNNLYFLVVTGVIVLVGNWALNQLRLREFTLRYELARSQRLLERNYEQLRAVDEMKGRFFANISHELRTPLTLLLAPLETLLASPAAADPRVRDSLETMHANGLRLLKLINDLLDLVRLDARKLALQRRAVPIAAFLRGLVKSLDKFAVDRGLRVSCDLEDEVGAAWADADKLEKIFLNLLFNSLKFTPAGGEVRVTGRREGPEIVVSVTDTGVGIAPEDLPHLGGRFWQADTSARRKYQGAGLGLALVWELVEAHSGHVTVASELGRGTTVAVHLPAAPEPTAASAEAAESPVPPDAPTAPTAAAPEQESWLHALYRRAELFSSVGKLRETLRPWTPEGSGARVRLLIADDEPDMLRFLRTQLADDYEVFEAVDGAQAATLAAQLLPDAVVCDMMLPEKDGLEVCRELRARTSTQNLPFLMLTARADEETKLTALAAGATDFLAKPFSVSELRLRLKNMVNAHRLQKELAVQNGRLASAMEELQETELQLVQMEKMVSLGRMSAGLIHEINNPLNFARTGVHVLARHAYHLPEEARAEFEDTLRDVAEGVNRVAQIISDLRSFTHPHGGELEAVDVSPVVASALRFLAAEWKDKVEVTVEIPAGFQVPGVASRLTQVFVNLLQNSLDALKSNASSGRAPRIRVTAHEAGDRRLLRVWDNGPGVPPGLEAKIFDPFFTTKEVGQGTGLGLSIVHRILRDSGARISVASEPGQFCEFTLDFPASVDDFPPAETAG
jgi:signal transduction histidine kinase